MYKEILLAIDLNDVESQRKAIETAIDLTRTCGARLHVQTVVPSFGMSMVATYFPKDFEEKALESAAQALHDFVRDNIPEDVTVQHVVGHGTIYQEILRSAEDIGANLIVMASHRPELQDYLIGPNAARVVRHAKCSVLVVRG